MKSKLWSWTQHGCTRPLTSVQRLCCMSGHISGLGAGYLPSALRITQLICTYAILSLHAADRKSPS